MAKHTLNNLKLGVFIIAGLLVLVVSLYFIGRSQNFFGSNFRLKARFSNVNGLMPGNNVRFSGIQCGTVKDIEIINDTTIEVRLLIRKKTSPYIRSNARAAIGTEGLMGNKVINILPGKGPAPAIEEGGMLQAASDKSMDELLGMLSATGDNVLAVSADLKTAAAQISGSPALHQLLSDSSLAPNLRQSLYNLRLATARLQTASASVNLLAGRLQQGKGAAGILLSDPVAEQQLSDAITHLGSAALRAESMLAGMDSLVGGIRAELDQGRGALHMLLKDSSVVQKVHNSLDHIEQGTEAFSRDMEALKHNFLLRGYFRKLERRKAAAER